MPEQGDRPELHFFRTAPEPMILRPPLCSSLQNVETVFVLIAFERFPHALVTCASAIESSMKAALSLPPDDRINAEKLYMRALDRYPALGSYHAAELKDFRFTRNQIAHYGFSPPDDETSARLLLRTGFPFLCACYQQFFGFDLQHGLVPEFGEHFGIALRAYEQAKDFTGARCSSYFSAFGHLIRWSVRQSLMADWENRAAEHAGEIGMDFDQICRRKTALEHALRAAWAFDCPICDGMQTLVCELDDDQLGQHNIALLRGECAHCGLWLPKTCPLLANALCHDQIVAKQDVIFKEYGIR